MKPTLPDATPVSFFTLVWRTFVRSALLPIVLIEVVLVLVYLLTNSIMLDKNIEHMQQVAKQQLSSIVNLEARHIEDELNAVRQFTGLLRDQVEQAWQRPYNVPDTEKQRYHHGPDGVFHTDHGGPGQSAMFFSNLHPLTPASEQSIWRTAQLDPLLHSLVEQQPLVTRAFINTPDGMTRIAPYLDVHGVLPADLDVTRYNFFFEADQQHNPSREVRWTDVYVDPAGQGWLASSVAPVYIEDQLVAVVGLNVTVNRLVNHVLKLDVPWFGYGVLINKEGTLLAVPPNAEQEWGLDEFTTYSYAEAIRSSSLKPEDFNISRREETLPLAQAITHQPQGLMRLKLNGQQKMMAWERVPGTGWSLLLVVDEQALYQQAYELNSTFGQIALFMVVGLLTFYILFFAFMYRHMRHLSGRVTRPLELLRVLMNRIAQNEQPDKRPEFGIQELQDTADGLLLMGEQLLSYNKALEEAKQRLEQLNLHLEAKVQERTQELRSENQQKQTLIEQLKDTQAQLIQSEKMASIGQLSAGIAHEINNPLAYISANVEALGGYVQDLCRLLELYQAFLEQHPELNHEELDSLSQEIDLPFLLADLPSLIEDSKDGIRRVKRIIDDLRSFSRSGQQDWDYANLNACIDSSLNIAHNVLKHQARVVKDYATLPEVYCVASLLNQVILNLLINAGQALSQLPAGSGEIRISTGQTSDSAYIRIQDNGCGIEQEHLSRIFEPFFTTKPVGQGTGLGLSMSYAIMEKHGGRIEVESCPGQGSTFILWLPLHPVHEPAEA
ncbi:ATP-binding protein [Balneatrix alpica]|uniref:histidine kinase n=1 Tax=Balneatrix alpica TaxID=75684 RepID=A0ABV5ZAR7_9GAMM|nr:ATP-binding protein [Balneatrix alpica]